MTPPSLRPERTPARVSPAELLGTVRERLDGGTDGCMALVAIALTPSDRALAIGLGEHERPVLTEVAFRIESLLRDGDRYAFVSREELWVMLGSLPSEALAELASRTLLERLRRPIALSSADGATTVLRLRPAIGVAWAFPGAGADAVSMLSAAGEAMSPQDGSGEQRIELRQVSGAGAGQTARLQIEQDLARALNEHALEVHFQPQIELAGGECRSAEALIRWRHADGHWISPETIVAICEQRGLIMQLTRFTINTTLRQISFWDASGVGVTVAVNLSAATLSDSSLPMVIEQALQTWDIAPARLTIELTEGALIRNPGVARESMQALHRLGCPLSIDDFGTGYSPYTYLRQFAFDELKIDRSFVQRITRDKADLGIVKSLVDLAHTFGMQAVAEGVEDAATLALLRQLGCDLAQGWHMSAALSPDEFYAWCTARRAQARAAAPGTLESADVDAAAES